MLESLCAASLQASWSPNIPSSCSHLRPGSGLLSHRESSCRVLTIATKGRLPSVSAKADGSILSEGWASSDTQIYLRPTYHQLTHPPRRGPHVLIHLPRRGGGAHRLIHPPRQRRGAPHRLIQIPALASGAFASQAPPNPTAAIAAPDHLPMLRRNKRLFSDCCSFSGPVVSDDGSLFITIE